MQNMRVIRVYYQSLTATLVHKSYRNLEIENAQL